MGPQSELDLANTFKRLQRALIRYQEVCGTVNSLCGFFQNVQEVQGNRFSKRGDLLALLPEVLLIRALVREGLALSEQMLWDAYLMEESEQFGDSRSKQEFSTFLNSIGTGVWNSRSWLDGVEKQIGVFQDAVLNSINTLDRVGEEISGLFRPVDLARIQKMQKSIRAMREAKRSAMVAAG